MLFIGVLEFGRVDGLVVGTQQRENKGDDECDAYRDAKGRDN